MAPPPPSNSTDDDPPPTLSYAQKLLANLTVSHSNISTPPPKPNPKPPQNRTSRQPARGGYLRRPARVVIPRPAAQRNNNGYRPPNMGNTENGSATYVSSGNPCLDFFFHVVPDTPSETLIKLLRPAWAFDPLTTLKLVCNLRGVRGTGKTDKEGFFTAAFWIFKNHPNTFASNVPSYPVFGCFKDLPEILFRLMHGYKVREIRRKQWQQRRSRRRRRLTRRAARMQRQRRLKKLGLPLLPHDVSVQKEKEKARALREEKKLKLAGELIYRFNVDNKFRLLYNEISRHFADCLKSDMESLKSGKLNKISLAAKWCPSLDSSYDRSTLLCESIARNIFTLESYPEYQGIEDAHYAYRIRDRLRKEVLVPLRKVLELPEVYIGANQWGSIPYNRVSSVAMNFYRDKFKAHDEERFTQYLNDVKSGKAKIAAGAVLPHEIIAPFLGSQFRYGYDDDDDNDTRRQVAELQWNRMVQDLLKTGKLDNCMAVCDVSGSMTGRPMSVSVALGILVSELSREPWKGKLITFSEHPQLQLIQGDNLQSKAQFVESMDWGMNTDFQRVFDCILQVAKNGKLRADQMVKTLFVFSDMEFDKASANPWETDYQAIVRKFNAAGYGSVVPKIVFWNLRDSKSVPVMGTEPGVALMSGFSKNLIKVFLDSDGVFNPVSVMMDVISGAEYGKLVVVD